MADKRKAPDVVEGTVAVIQKIKAEKIDELKAFFESIAAKDQPCIVIGHRLTVDGEIDHLHVFAESEAIRTAAQNWGRKVRFSDCNPSPEEFVRYATTRGCVVIVNNTR